METRTGQSLYLQEDMCHVLSVHAKRAARTTTTGPLLRLVLFPHHVNYHVEDDLYPAVPHYNFRRRRDSLAKRGTFEGTEIRGFGATWRRVFAPPLALTMKT